MISLTKARGAEPSGSRGLRSVATTVCHLFSTLVPARLADALSRDPRDVLVIAKGPGHYELATVAGPRHLGINLSDDVRRLAGPGAALTIAVPRARVFARRLMVPGAALSRLDDVLALDLERATPFERTSIVTAHRFASQPARDGAVLVEQLVMKSDWLEPLLAAARSVHLPVKAIRLSEDDGHDALNFLPATMRQRSWLTRTLQRSAYAAGALLALLTVAVTLLHLWQVERDVHLASTRQAQLTTEVAALRREAEAADLAMRDARAARARRVAHPLTVAVLEDISRRLPNLTWLTDLRIDAVSISIEGHSTNAAELVALLSRSPFLASASFAAPTTRDPTRGTERFRIQMMRHAAQTTP